jgi:hypothetical protein
MKPSRIPPTLAMLLLLGTGLATAGPASAAKPAPAPKPAPASKLKSVTLAIRSRVFHQFSDQQVVVQGKSFPIGDTDFSARIVQYVPDFAMEFETRKVISRSAEPRNPAFRLIVSQKGKAQDTTWAMMSLPPHFTRKSFLAFKVMRIDFVGREPIVADSVAAVKELEALKDLARKSRPTEAEPSPHGAMGMNPHGAAGVSPHGGAAGASPHGGATPHGGTSIPVTPSHGGGSSDAKGGK